MIKEFKKVPVRTDWSYGSSPRYDYIKIYYSIWNIHEEKFIDYIQTDDTFKIRADCKRLNDEYNSYQKEIIAYCNA